MKIKICPECKKFMRGPQINYKEICSINKKELPESLKVPEWCPRKGNKNFKFPEEWYLRQLFGATAPPRPDIEVMVLEYKNLMKENRRKLTIDFLLEPYMLAIIDKVQNKDNFHLIKYVYYPEKVSTLIYGEKK